MMSRICGRAENGKTNNYNYNNYYYSYYHYYDPDTKRDDYCKLPVQLFYTISRCNRRRVTLGVFIALQIRL